MTSYQNIIILRYGNDTVVKHDELINIGEYIHVRNPYDPNKRRVDVSILKVSYPSI